MAKTILAFLLAFLLAAPAVAQSRGSPPVRRRRRATVVAANHQEAESADLTKARGLRRFTSEFGEEMAIRAKKPVDIDK